MSLAIYRKREGHATYVLQQEDVTRYDAVNFIRYMHAMVCLPNKTPVTGDDERELSLILLLDEIDKLAFNSRALAALVVTGSGGHERQDKKSP